MKTEYRNELNCRYMFIEAEEGYEADFRVNMIRMNRISGFLPCSTNHIDNRIRFRYEITGRKSLQEVLLTEKAGLTVIRNLIASILELQETCGRYLLDMKNVILQTEYIFIEKGKCSFCYLPT